MKPRYSAVAAALAVGLLCAQAHGEALSRTAVSQHQHDEASHGGVTLRPRTVDVTGRLTASTAAFNSLSAPGLYVLIASATFTDSSAYTFSGLASSTAYRLELNLKTGRSTPYDFQAHFISTRGALGRTFFNQHVLNYTGTIENWQLSANDSLNGVGGIQWNCANHPAAATSFVYGAMDFETQQSSISIVRFRGVSESSDTLANNSFSNANWMGRTTLDPSGLGGVWIGIFSGTMTGTAFLYKRIDPATYSLANGISLSSIPAHDHSGDGYGGGTLVPSSASVTGPYFSVGGSSLIVNGSSVTINGNLRVNSKIGVGRAPTTDDFILVPSASGRGIVVQETDDGNAACRISANSTRGAIECFNGGVSAVLLNASADSYLTNSLGLGAAVPSSKLHVEGGSITFRGASTGIIFPYNSGDYVRAHNSAGAAVSLLSLNGNNWVNVAASGQNGVNVPTNLNVITTLGVGRTVDSQPQDKLHLSSGTIILDGNGTAPTKGGALCLNAAGRMTKCTSAIDASGDCTCP